MKKSKYLLFLLLALLPLKAFAFDVQDIQKDFHKHVTLLAICSEAKNCSHPEHRTKIVKKIQKTYISYPYWNALKEKLSVHKKSFTHSQFITVIDLSRQLLILLLWKDTKKSFHFIGSDLISSGNMEKESKVTIGEDHYLKTPTGIYRVKGGWRSDGKVLDDNITLPYGKKDRFVYYFGKQKSIRYNTFDKNGTKITDKKKWQLIEGELEFAIHAHKSTTTLGKPFSHGCIRMSNELNIFLDNNLVLHKNAFDGNRKWDMRYIQAPNYDKNNTLAGEYLFVFDKILKR